MHIRIRTATTLAIVAAGSLISASTFRQHLLLGSVSQQEPSDELSVDMKIKGLSSGMVYLQLKNLYMEGEGEGATVRFPESLEKAIEEQPDKLSINQRMLPISEHIQYFGPITWENGKPDNRLLFRVLGDKVSVQVTVDGRRELAQAAPDELFKR